MTRVSLSFALILMILAGVVLGCQAVSGLLPGTPPASVTPTVDRQPTLVFTLAPTTTPRSSPTPRPTSTPTPAATPPLSTTAVISHNVWLPMALKGTPAETTPLFAAAMLTPTQGASAPRATATLTPPQAVTVPILMYHYVSELPENADAIRKDLTVTPERFEAQLAYLREQGYTGLTLFDLYAVLRGEAELPAKPIVLTFDDGYADAYTEAFPRLQKYGFPGTFFVIAYVVEGQVPGYLTWEQARAMAEAGMSIQSHSLDHVDLRERSAEFLKQQLEGSRALIEARVGQPVRFFCYPAGRYDEGTVRALERAGYWGAVTTVWGSEHTLRERYTWSRLRVRGEWDLETFKQVLPSWSR